MRQTRALVVVADDFGMGHATSRGILELAQQGLVTGSVLMVNSPYAEAGVADWRKAGQPFELGWHPSLTSDAPILPASRVPTLVDADGKFWTLGKLIKRLFFGRVASADIEVELRAQYNRFRDLVGHAPTLVNSHQHVTLFQPVGFILLHILAQRRPLPYVRCVREPWSMLRSIPGARCKRAFLSFLGKPLAKKQQALGFLGNDWLAGITDPRWVRDPQFLVRWLSRIPGDVVELACHPGYYDASLIGRDCTANDGLLQRRVDELALLNHPSFVEACAAAGFERMPPSALSLFSGTYKAYAA